MHGRVGGKGTLLSWTDDMIVTSFLTQVHENQSWTTNTSGLIHKKEFCSASCIMGASGWRRKIIEPPEYNYASRGGKYSVDSENIIVSR